MMLKDPIDHVHVVENAQHDRGFFVGQPIEILANHLVEAAIRPSFDGNQLRVTLSVRERAPSTAEAALHVRSECALLPFESLDA